MYPIFPAQLADTINLGSEFDILHNGSDMTANLAAAFAKYGARKYRLPRIGSGLCVFESAVTIPNGAILENDDDVAISALQFNVSGSVGSQIAFSAAGNKGDQAIQLTSVTGVAPDTWLLLQGCVSLSNSDGGTDQLLWDSANSVYAGEFVRVASVSGNTVNIWGALRWGYTLAPGPTTTTRACSTAQVVNFGGAIIRRGTIYPIVGNANSVFQGAFVRGLNLDEVIFDHRSGGASPGEPVASLALYTSLDCYTDRCTVLREPYGYAVYSGISLRTSINIYGSSGCAVRGSLFDGGSAAFNVDYGNGLGGAATGGDVTSWGHSFIDCTVRNTYIGADSHGGGKQHKFDRNVIENCEIGIKVRTPETSASFNTVVGMSATGSGVSFMDGFLDGCEGIGNDIEGSNYGVYVNWNNAGGSVTAGRVLIQGGSVNRCGVNIYVQTTGTVQQQDALHRAVRVFGAESSAPINAHLHVDPYANGAEVDGCVFVGAPSGYASQSGAIGLSNNIADARVGTNAFVNIGSLVAVSGPGSTILADATTWPAGDASANWTIGDQLLRGTNGGLSTGMPSNNLFLGANGGFINALRQGRLALQAGAAQTSNPLAVTNGSSDLLAVNASGKLTGSVADAFMPAVYAAGMTDAMAVVFNTLFVVQAVVTGGLHGLYGFNFITGPVYRAQGASAQNLLASVSGWSLTRSGSTSGISARAYDAGGNAYQFSGSAPRLVAGRGLGIFEAATNLDTNGDMAGTPHPTNWQMVLATGLSYTETGSGTEFGRKYVEIAISGSTSSSQVSSIQFATTGEIAALTGQTFVLNHGLRLSAGALTNVSAVQPKFIERNSSGGGVLSTYGSALTVTSALQDVVFTDTLSGGASTAYVCPALTFTSNGAVSFSLRIYEPMTRKASVAVPYVETSGSTATIGGDAGVLSSVSLGSAWTCFVEAETNASDAATQVLAQWDDGTDNNRIAVYRDTSGVVWAQVYVAGSSTFTASASGQTGDVTVRVAISVGSGNINVSFNQGTVATSAAPSLPTPTELRLGNNVAGTAALNGYARAALFGTSALTGAALQALQA